VIEAFEEKKIKLGRYSIITYVERRKENKDVF
jgi:hypothetical protein